MTRLSAHLGYLFTELPLAERLGAAAKAGFDAVEHPAPYEISAAEMRARLGDLGLTFSQITTGMGGAGEKGLACLAGREAEFADAVKRARDYALEVGIPYLHPMAGVPLGAGDGEAVYRANIEASLRALEGSGIRLLIEPITIAGYHMASFEAAMALQDALDGQPALLFDSYHAKVLGVGAEWVAQHAARLGHIHIADHPGRHEPGSGALDFEALLSALEAAGYEGAIGFEYIPSTTTEASLAFLPAWRARYTGARYG